MFNRTPVGGRYSQALPVIDPRQAPPPPSTGDNRVPPTALPAQQPSPGAARFSRTHRLQQQISRLLCGQADGERAGRRSPAMRDTANWNINANLHPGTALTILNNFERDFDLQGSYAAQQIAHARHWLSNPNPPSDASAVAGILRAVSEAVYSYEIQKIGPSRAARQTGRMPMDCMTHLGYELRRALDAASPAQQQFLRRLGIETMDRVMRHSLSFDSTKAWLNDVKTVCDRRGLGHIGRLAGQLGDAIPASGSVHDHAAQLHDNVYGRALESVLISELVRQPPPSVKQSMTALSRHLDDALSRLGSSEQNQVALMVHNMVHHERRGWQAQSPELEAFFVAPRGQEMRTLKRLLRAPKETGADCISVPYLAVKVSVCLGVHAPWMPKANDNYRDVIGPASARETERVRNPNRIAPKAGITRHHQPDTVRTDPAQASMHPGDRNRPMLHAPSPELHRALQSGVPFVSGVSGSTNIVMHAVGHMLEKGSNIDAKDALLGTMMFLTHDGGHSMHEALWVGNQLDRSLNLGIGMPGDDPSRYVADYKDFIESFSPDKGRDTLLSAAASAWRVTLDQFGRTSHFSPDNPPP